MRPITAQHTIALTRERYTVLTLDCGHRVRTARPTTHTQWTCDQCRREAKAVSGGTPTPNAAQPPIECIALSWIPRWDWRR